MPPTNEPQTCNGLARRWPLGEVNSGNQSEPEYSTMDFPKTLDQICGTGRKPKIRVERAKQEQLQKTCRKEARAKRTAPKNILRNPPQGQTCEGARARQYRRRVQRNKFPPRIPTTKIRLSSFVYSHAFMSPLNHEAPCQLQMILSTNLWSNE